MLVYKVRTFLHENIETGLFEIDLYLVRNRIFCLRRLFARVSVKYGTPLFVIFTQSISLNPYVFYASDLFSDFFVKTGLMKIHS